VPSVPSSGAPKLGYHGPPMTLTRLIVLTLSALASSGVVAEQLLPARFEHDRVFLVATAPNGAEVLFYTDTGGGFNAIAESVASEYSLAHRGSAAADDGELSLVQFPEFAERSGIPSPGPDPWLGRNLAVVPGDRLKADGLLGSRWFAGRIWKFDYPKETLSRIKELDRPAYFEEIPLGFRADADGVRDLNFPRITIRIDGEPLEMLLDTGATAQLTESAASEYGLPAGTVVGANYIIRSKFEQWRGRNADWQVVMEGEAVTGQAFPMIEVPEVQIGDIRVGPVWFSVRPDNTFLNWMSQMMDRQIVGAVGGSMLRHFEMILYYPASKAYFREPSNDAQRNDAD